MNRIWFFMTLLLGFGILHADPWLPSKVEVFYNWELPVSQDFKPISPFEVIYYPLDAPNELRRTRDAEGNETLTMNIETDREGEPIEHTSATITQKIKAILASKSLLMKYDLEWLPAIVFDGGSSVVYGEENVQEAIERYRIWKQKQ